MNQDGPSLLYHPQAETRWIGAWWRLIRPETVLGGERSGMYHYRGACIPVVRPQASRLMSFLGDTGVPISARGEVPRAQFARISSAQ